MNKVLNMLGLAKRAGKVVSGTFLCTKAIKDGSSKLILIAQDCSPGSKKAVIDSCNYYSIPFIEYADMELLGKFTGNECRAVVSVNDSNFAKAILDKYSESSH